MISHYSKCGNCKTVSPNTEIVPLEETKGLGERLDPGSIVPSGECAECGALCYQYHLPALVLEDPFNEDESGLREFLMVEGYTSAWITVGGYSVYIVRNGDGPPLVEVSKRGEEA